MHERARDRANERKRRRRRTVFGVVLVAVLSLLAWQGVRFWNRPLATAATAPNPTADTSRFSVLLVGADDRPGEPGRSDTMMIGFVDLGAGSIKLISIPRDSYVEIPGHGYDKINAAYAYGKEDLARQAVQDLIGMPIDYTMTVNMEGFQKIVNAVGGVDINVDEKMDYDDPSDTPPLHIHLTKGMHHLDGTDALHYVRFRHDSENDWGRMKRQQAFLKALLHQVKQPANLTHIPELLKLGMENVRTNLSPAQLTKMAMLAKDKLNDQSIAGQTLPGNDLWTKEGYYLTVDLPKVRSLVREAAGITPDSAALAQDQQDETAYEAALPKGSSDASAWTGNTAGSGATAGAGAGGAAASGSGATAPKGTGANGSGATSSNGNGSVIIVPAAPSGSGTGADTPATPGGAGTTQSQHWQVVVIDGSGGTQSSLINSLPAQGFEVLSVRQAQGVMGDTIVWYGGPAEAAIKLRALVPNAQFLHMAPGPADPPLRLILGPKK